MDLQPSLALLDELVSDKLIEAAWTEMLLKCEMEDGCVHVELEAVEGGYIAVPVEAALEVITKAFFESRFDMSFGHFVVQVAIGGVVGHEASLPKARYCFATLFFNENAECFTADFHRELR